ncbi:hypothetical protein B0H14DRAFT_2596350 [Mycena olivaceomarginata]|nr:hypothetical protein B0H14DRAFT_2596350 [Mycena olivaceomarginata]
MDMMEENNTHTAFRAKYGLAITMRESPPGPLAEALNLKMLVGTSHGHAHNRSCQLKHLATYVLGLGLEDLETCEKFFSKSNRLARAVQYASVFHRRQAIAMYLAHMDTFETYANLSTFLVNNYKQALEQIDLEDSLKGLRQERLRQEQEYLRGLSKEPEAETDQMEYYTRLVYLASRKERYEEAHHKGSTANGTTRWHAKENYNRAVQEVQEMEKKMDILVRWTVDDEEYENAAALVASRHYCMALNQLEELVVKRLFELTKMNMSGTGYKLWKDIANTLQTQSKTRAALGQYNAAATSMDPPHCTLKWEEVVEDEQDFLVAKEEEIRETDPDLAFFVHRYHMERGHFDNTHMRRLRKLQATYKERFTGTLKPGVRRKESDIPAPMVVNDQQVQREVLEAEMHRVLAGGDGEDDGWETDGGDDGWETDDGDKEEEEEELAGAIETVFVLDGDGGNKSAESLNRVMAVVEVSRAQVAGKQMDAVEGWTEAMCMDVVEFTGVTKFTDPFWWIWWKHSGSQNCTDPVLVDVVEAFPVKKYVKQLLRRKGEKVSGEPLL